MNRKFNVILALLLAIFMMFSYGSAAYADTSTSGSEETTVQSSSDNSESEDVSVQSTSEDSASEDVSVQSTSDDSESEEVSVQSTSDDSESEDVSVQSTSDDSESEDVTVQSTSSSTDESEGTSIQSTTYNGSTDISGAAVDSITVTDEDGTDISSGILYNWSNFIVTVNFSEDDADGNQKSGLDIQGGDTITVTWTAPTGITITGYSSTVSLYMEGTTILIGTAVITEDGCTITFNDNVNNLQHVSGSITFYIYISGTVDESDTDGTITSGNITTEFTVADSTGSGEVGFSSKSATYATDGSKTITWSIWINEDYRTDLIGNIVIVDTLPDTETFDSFVYYTSRDTSGNWEGIAYTLDAFNSGDRSFTVDGNTITITIPASELNTPITGLVVFTTTSTAATGTSVENTATVTYKESSDTEETTDTDTASVTVIGSDGEVTGAAKGTIIIQKVVDGTTDPVSGVHFRVYKLSTAGDSSTRISGWYDGADYVEIVSDENGIAEIDNLIDGYYEIEEISDDLPNWIAESSIQTVYATVSGSAGESITVENSVKTGDITATKYWTENDGTTADISDEDRTVYFQLYRDGEALTDDDLPNDQSAIQAVVTAAGESSSTVTWEDLPLYDNSGNAYTYTVKEVDANGDDYTPDGYTKTESGLTVTNSKEITYSDITATKNWVQNDGTTADTSDHPTIYFQLYRNGTALTDDDLTDDQTAIQAVVTASGESTATVTWTDLPDTDSAGNAYTYTVKEVDADGNDYTPDSYTKNEDGLTVTNISDYHLISTDSSEDTETVTDTENSLSSSDSDRSTETTTATSTSATSTSATSTTETSASETSASETSSADVQTGDTQNIAIWIVLLLLAMATAGVLINKKIKKNR
jgi:hypothetical protein